MRIGELADAAGTSTKTLRFYEEQGLLPEPERTPSGYRDYGLESLDRIGFIHRGQASGLTLAQIREVLDIRDGGHAPCEHVRDLLGHRLADIDAQIHRLTELREAVARLHDEAAEVNPDSCGPDAVCRYV